MTANTNDTQSIQTLVEDKAELEKQLAEQPEVSTPRHLPKVNNLAGDAELGKMFADYARKQFEHFRSQTEREKYVSDEDSTMNVADKMLRCSLNRETTSKQYQPTLSDVSSTIFFRQHRALTSSINSIFLDEKDLPAEYEPEINTNVYSAEDGRWVAEQRNMLALHTFDEDKRRERIKDIVHSVMQYGNVMVSDEWERRSEVMKVRVAGYYDEAGEPQPYDPDDPPSKMYDRDGEELLEIVDEQGTPNHFVFVERRVVVADHPTLLVHDVKDCFFDAQLDDAREWRCFIKLGKLPYERLLNMQAAGEIVNVDKIRPSHLYAGDVEETLDNRKDNAGEDASSGPTGLVDVFHVWGVVPIKEHKRAGKGKWDAGKTLPKMYWGLYAGDIRTSAVVPLKIVRNPFAHGSHPYRFIHSLRDDKGAFHKGIVDIIEPLYWQHCTNLNMTFDNIMERNRAPWICDGAIRTRDLTFRPDKLIRKARGTTLERVEVPDTTQLTMQLNERVEKDMDTTTGANVALQAEPMGARTSALEAKNVFDQAMLTLDDMAAYIADQLFNWLYETDASLWDQFGDPSRVVMVTRNDKLEEVKPSHIWGPVKVKVTAVSRFKNNVARRQEVNMFIQNVMPVAAQLMGPEGQKAFFMDAFKLFGFKNAMDYLPEHSDFDAMSRAVAAGRAMLDGRWIDPQPTENHAAWMKVLQPMAREYAMLPDADRNDAGLRLLQQHIEARRGMMQGGMVAGQGQGQQGPQAAQGQPAIGIGEALPGNEAEMLQNPLEAQEGAMANG